MHLVAISMTAGRPLYSKEGFPAYWQREQGQLPESIKAYLAHVAAGQPPPTAGQLRDVIWYFGYYVSAPCWDHSTAGDPRMSADLAELRARAKTLASVESIRRWLQECLDTGLDPL